jgi:hypothetical protein
VDGAGRDRVGLARAARRSRARSPAWVVRTGIRVPHSKVLGTIDGGATRLTDLGWEGVRAARAVIEELEAEYARIVGQERFEDACRVLQELIDALGEREP